VGVFSVRKLSTTAALPLWAAPLGFVVMHCNGAGMSTRSSCWRVAVDRACSSYSLVILVVLQALSCLGTSCIACAIRQQCTLRAL
jgi:hypothetical protein